jgi:hypothetical protein
MKSPASGASWKPSSRSRNPPTRFQNDPRARAQPPAGNPQHEEPVGNRPPRERGPSGERTVLHPYGVPTAATVPPRTPQPLGLPGETGVELGPFQGATGHQAHRVRVEPATRCLHRPRRRRDRLRVLPQPPGQPQHPRRHRNGEEHGTHNGKTAGWRWGRHHVEDTPPSPTRFQNAPCTRARSPKENKVSSHAQEEGPGRRQRPRVETQAQTRTKIPVQDGVGNDRSQIARRLDMAIWVPCSALAIFLYGSGGLCWRSDAPHVRERAMPSSLMVSLFSCTQNEKRLHSIVDGHRNRSHSDVPQREHGAHAWR